MRIAIIIGTLLLAASCFAMGHSTVMLAMVSGPSAPSAVTGLSASNSPAQITVSWSAATGASTYDVYYALSSSASIIPANNDCTYMLETSYTSGLTAYPGTPNATAGYYTGLTGTSYTINGPLTSGSSYCVAVSGVNSGIVQGTLSGTTYATVAAAAHGTLTLTASTASLTGSGLSCGSGMSGTDANGSPIETFTCTASSSLSFTYMAVGSGGESDDYTNAWSGDSSVKINGTTVVLAPGSNNISTPVYTTKYVGGTDDLEQGFSGAGAGTNGKGANTSLGWPAMGGSSDGIGGAGADGSSASYDSDGTTSTKGGAGSGGSAGDDGGNGGTGGNVSKITSASISSGQSLVIAISKGGVGETTGGDGSGYIVW